MQVLRIGESVYFMNITKHLTKKRMIGLGCYVRQHLLFPLVHLILCFIVNILIYYVNNLQGLII
jgi:hypothetical protein